MDPDILARLSDLRILRLVAHVDEAREAFSRETVEQLPPGDVRDEAEAALGVGEARVALLRALSEHEEALAAVAEGAEPRTLLQALRDSETFAHDFYLGLLDRLRTPGLVDVLRDLAEETNRRERAVGRADEVLESVR